MINHFKKKIGHCRLKSCNYLQNETMPLLPHAPPSCDTMDNPRICSKVFCKAVLPPASEHLQKCCQKCQDRAKEDSAAHRKRQWEDRDNRDPLQPAPALPSFESNQLLTWRTFPRDEDEETAPVSAATFDTTFSILTLSKQKLCVYDNQQTLMAALWNLFKTSTRGCQKKKNYTGLKNIFE
jgi:hypothetical protein